ncbi:MAG TPA: hypothetical protein VGM78_04440 [Ilumatobacteraceae bacterium]
MTEPARATKRARPGRRARLGGAAIVVAAVVAFLAISSITSRPNCKAVGYIDRVEIVLPASITGVPSTLSVCIDGACSQADSDGQPSVTLVGTTLEVVGPLPSGTVTVRLIATDVPLDASVQATAETDDHGGCGSSRTIELRLDPTTRRLVPADHS